VSSHPPRFVVVAGPPCAGKSTVARQLARRLSAPHLEMDQFRRRLLPGSDQRVEHRDIAYRAMHLAAELLASHCETIVLDATYTAEPCRTELLRVVDRVRGSISVVECRVGARVAAERFLRRGPHPARDLTAERVTTLASTYPYCSLCRAVDGELNEDGVGWVVHDILEKPLDRAGRLVWASNGRPRERRRAPRGRPDTADSPRPMSDHDAR
jgi:predicted kinase